MVGAINLSTVTPKKCTEWTTVKKKKDDKKLISVQHACNEASMKLSHIMQITSHILLTRKLYTCHVNYQTALQPWN